MNVKLTREQKKQVLNSTELYPIMQRVLLRENKIRRNQEHFWVVGLNSQSKLLFIELVALGMHNRVSANPPEVFRLAIYKMATQLIFVHNHPGGTLEASKEDKGFTDHMFKAGKLLNIEVVDHLIITETGYVSMADTGIMAELRINGSFLMANKEREDLQKMLVQVEREIAQHKEREEMAKRMLKEGAEFEFVKRVTKLTKREIEKVQVGILRKKK